MEQSNPLVTFLPLLLILVLFWLLFIRPARRRQQSMTRLQAGLERGREVMTNSGLFGTVQQLDERTVRLEIAPGVVVRMLRQSVVRVVDQDGPPGENGGPGAREA